MKKREWFEESDFWERLYPFIFPLERLERGDEEVENILQLTGLTSGRVLDLCCGPGRHAVALARSGFQVTAVDLTSFLLKKGEELALREGLTIEWVQEDMRRFTRDNTYDLVVNLFTSFGFFEEEEDNRRVITNIYQSLREGGVFILEMMGKEILAHHYQKTRSRLSNDRLFIERNEIMDGWRQVRNHWILVKDGITEEYRFNLWLYSSGEISSLLKEIGFKEIQIFGDLEGGPYNIEARRLIIKASK